MDESWWHWISSLKSPIQQGRLSGRLQSDVSWCGRRIYEISSVWQPFLVFFQPWRDERGGVITVAAALPSIAAHGAADWGRRGGAVVGERPGAPRGAAAVGRRRAAAVGPPAAAHGGHREQHLRAPPDGRLRLGLGVGGVERGALGGVGAGGGRARRDAGRRSGLRDAGDRDRDRGGGRHLLAVLLALFRWRCPPLDFFTDMRARFVDSCAPASVRCPFPFISRSLN